MRFIFFRGSIYLLWIYSYLLAESVFQPTHTHPQEELCGIHFKMYEDLLKNTNKSGYEGLGVRVRVWVGIDFFVGIYSDFSDRRCDLFLY